MTEAELEAIEARANAATPGPWFDIDQFEEDYPVEIALTNDPGKYGHEQKRSEFTDADRDFIAHARTDIPTLVAEVRRLRAENTRQHAILGTCQACAHTVDNHWEDGCHEQGCDCDAAAYRATVYL